MRLPARLPFAALLLFLALFALSSRSTASHNQSPIYRLQPPAFVKTAYASGEEAEALQSILEEAGIAAYFQTSGSINLNSVRSLFRTIESETSSYLIGSIPAQNYPERWDVHAYVHADGWIMAYYLAEDPVAKIIDVRGWTIENTLLENTVASIAGSLGEPFDEATYYDFRYPNATHMLLVGEDHDNGRDFIIEIPSAFGYYERSWAMRGESCCNGDHFLIDDVEIASSYRENRFLYGRITVAQLSTDTPHTVSYYDGGYIGLAIIYQVP